MVQCAAAQVCAAAPTAPHKLCILAEHAAAEISVAPELAVRKIGPRPVDAALHAGGTVKCGTHKYRILFIGAPCKGNVAAPGALRKIRTPPIGAPAGVKAPPPRGAGPVGAFPVGVFRQVGLSLIHRGLGVHLPPVVASAHMHGSAVHAIAEDRLAAVGGCRKMCCRGVYAGAQVSCLTVAAPRKIRARTPVRFAQVNGVAELGARKIKDQV